MSYKMVFIDIDGTLLNPQHSIGNRTKDVIQLLHNEMHIPVVLATARPYYGAYFFRTELGLQTPIICFNGALIVDPSGTPIANFTIDENQANIVTTTALSLQLNLAYLDLDQAYALKRNVWITLEEELTKKKATIKGYQGIVKDWEQRQIDGPNKIMGLGEPDQIQEFQQRLKNNQDINLTINISHPSYLEITNKDASKQHAIKHLHDEYGVQASEVIAIGDSFNDIEMIRYAGMGIAMGNAHPDVQHVANKVTTENFNDGVATALTELFQL